MRTIRIRTIIFALLIFLILLSGYLTYTHSVGVGEGVCLVDQNGLSSCADVQNSVYGVFLGMKVCHWGLIAFSLLLIIYFVASTKNRFRRAALQLFLFMTFGGSLIALYFIYIQLFVLKTLCSTCMMVDLAMILVFVLAFAEHNRKHR